MRESVRHVKQGLTSIENHQVDQMLDFGAWRDRPLRTDFLQLAFSTSCVRASTQFPFINFLQKHLFL